MIRGWEIDLEAVIVLLVCVNSCIGWAMALVIVNCRDASTRNCKGWEITLDMVDLLKTDVRMFRDCWTDLMNVPEDWARACRERICDVDLLAVNSLAASARSCMGCVRALDAVSCLAVDVNKPRVCWTVFRKDPTDWVRVCTERVCEAILVGFHCLVVWVRI